MTAIGMSDEERQTMRKQMMDRHEEMMKMSEEKRQSMREKSAKSQ